MKRIFAVAPKPHETVRPNVGAEAKCHETYSTVIPHIWSAKARRAASFAAEQIDPVVSYIP